MPNKPTKNLNCLVNDNGRESAEKRKLICYCQHVTYGEIVDACQNGAHNLAAIRQMTGACVNGNCRVNHPEKRCCSSDILQILNQSTP